MGKQAPELIIAALIVAALIILALDNATPVLALTFLGWQSVSLPLGVWLAGAIALGSLTGIVLLTLTEVGAPTRRPGRRRWTVRPDMPPHPDAGRSGDGTSQPRQPRWPGRSPQEFFRREPRSQDPPRESPRPEPFSQSGASSPSPAVAAEDWQAWGQRRKPSDWQDWSEASGNRPHEENLDRRQRRDRDHAEATIHNLDGGWDESAQDTVYVAPGGSDIDDVLDDIADGWDDWDSDDVPADTAYAQRFDGGERDTRRDAIYAPPDAATGDDTVYDADYRVIIPPNRSLDDDENKGDRAS
ncbi:MAG: LapA family protein [Leptolyngbyaceae cyanobacterium]